MNRRNQGVRVRWGITCLAVSLTVAMFPSCRSNPTTESHQQEGMARRDINAVLRDHDDTLMAIPGVVGVAVGLKEDGRTLCLKVMVVRKTREVVHKIPKILEGYPVVVEETGMIRPLKSD